MGPLSSEAEARRHRAAPGSWGHPRPGALRAQDAPRQRVLVSTVEPGQPQGLREPAQPWRAHTGVIMEIDHAQKSLITEIDSSSLL